MKRQALVKQFKKVGLVLKITDEPIGRTTNDDIFQMDVGRKTNGTRRTEWFEIWPGHDDNKIQILDIDNKLNQILLLVHEPERVFETEEVKRKSWKKGLEENADDRRYELHEQNIKFKETKTHFTIIEKTTPVVRHFLMGVDERQLFVAQLTEGVTNINVARSLLGNTVKFHEGVRRMSPKRQGEWFFLKSTPEQEDLIDLFIQKNKVWIRNKANIGEFAGRPRGNPHVADELVVITNDKETIERLGKSKGWRKRNPKRGVSVNYNQVYVRGKIRHIDHKTLKYTHWYQVVLNNEGATESATQSWID
jgi:hypothetical protein